MSANPDVTSLLMKHAQINTDNNFVFRQASMAVESLKQSIVGTGLDSDSFEVFSTQNVVVRFRLDSIVKCSSTLWEETSLLMIIQLFCNVVY